MEPESVDLISKVILAVITILCFGAVLIFFKKYLAASERVISEMIEALQEKQTEMNGSVKDIINKHHECREALPRDYVGMQVFLERKRETAEMFSKLFDKVDEVMKFLINGKPKKGRKKNG